MSIARPIRIFVEEPSHTVITTPTGRASPAGPTFPPQARESLVPTAQQTTSPAGQVSQREPLSPSWLIRGYDLNTQSTPAGRRWADQQTEDRQRAAKVLWHRTTSDTRDTGE